MLVSKFLHVETRRFAGNPAAAHPASAQCGGIVRVSGRRRDFAVQRHCRVQRDQGTMLPAADSVAVVQAACLLLAPPGFSLNAGWAKLLKTTSAGLRVGEVVLRSFAQPAFRLKSGC